MTTMLHDAIEAVRAGDMERAQLLAANNVQDNPDDPNAWYLLSQLVVSDARRAAYLHKTLSLDPDHPRATAEFAKLPQVLVSLVTTGTIPPAAASTRPTEELGVTNEMILEAAKRVEAAAREERVDKLVTDMEPASDAAELIDENEVEEAEAIEIEEVAIEEIAMEETLTEEDIAVPAAESVPAWLQPLGPQPTITQKPVAEISKTEVQQPVAVQQSSTQPKPAPRTVPVAARPKATAPAKKGSNQALSILLGVLGLLTILVLAVLVYLLLFS